MTTIRLRSARPVRLFAGGTILVLLGAATWLLWPPAKPTLSEVGGVHVLIDGVNGPASSQTHEAHGGTIAVVGDGCLGLRVGDAEKVVAWPRATTIDTDDDGNIRVRIERDTFQLGDTIIYGPHVERDWASDYKTLSSEACGSLPVTPVENVTTD